MRKRIELSVVVPIYNEEESTPVLCEAILHVCQSLAVPYEIIFIDDGSKDGTPQVLEKLHQEYSNIRVIQFRKNYGQTLAMAAGFRAARGKYVVSMDGDLQNDPADIPKILHTLEQGYGVVCGWRKDRKDKLVSRKIPSKIANWLIGKITRVPIHDNGCSLKGYRRSVVKQLPLYADFHRFIPAMSTLGGAKIAEIVVNHRERSFGSSKYGISRAWRVFLDLFVVSLIVRSSARPALWFGKFGLVALLAGIGCFMIFLAYNISGIVLPSVAFMFFALTGHLVALGVLGEMILATGDYRPGQMVRDGILAINRDKGASLHE
ncbi:MAG: glycosyltransferase family 2 protein [Nitrospirales bacterium]|nr:glycosyltransferase [Nitrospira sp.]MDR4501899.1 glycosyltransferase family 2 protein [Nitrospirales bacterium]